MAPTTADDMSTAMDIIETAPREVSYEWLLQL